MSSKSTQQTKKAKKKTPSGTQTRKSRPLSPGAATFEALNNPAYDTSERHFSPPMPISKPLIRSKSLDQLPRGATIDEDDATSPHIFPPPFPAKEEDEDELDFDFVSVPAPDVPLREERGGRRQKRTRRRRRTTKRLKTRRRSKRRAVTRGKRGKKKRRIN